MAVYKLNYGKEIIEFELDSRQVLGEIKSARMNIISNPQKKILDALENPIKNQPLKNIVKAGEKIAILVSDKTRDTKVRILLPELLMYLNNMGIPDADIFIVFAIGSHARQTDLDMIELIGPEIAERIRYIEHDSRDESNLEYLGTTSRGTRVELNREVLAADKIILTGAIVYHYFAGFGGGRKSIIPGIAAFKTTQANHKLVMNKEPGTGENPSASTGVLKGNPIHEDMIEALNMIKVDFMINVVLDDDDNLAGIFSGHPIEAHLEGCNFVNDNSRVILKEQADVVIVSSGGYPKDIDIVQAHKAIDNSFQACRPAGTMILLAACPDRYPNDLYSYWFKLQSLERIEEELRNNYSVPGHTVYSIIKKAQEINIILVSQMPGDEVKMMGMTPARTIKEALELTYEKMGSRRLSFYLVPQGKHTFSVCCKK